MVIERYKCLGPDKKKLLVSEEPFVVTCEFKDSVNTSSLSLLSLSNITERVKMYEIHFYPPQWTEDQSQ